MRLKILLKLFHIWKLKLSPARTRGAESAVDYLVDCLSVELNIAKDWVLALLWRKQYVYMQIERALALANLSHGLESIRRSDLYAYSFDFSTQEWVQYARGKLCRRPRRDDSQ